MKTNITRVSKDWLIDLGDLGSAGGRILADVDRWNVRFISILVDLPFCGERDVLHIIQRENRGVLHAMRDQILKSYQAEHPNDCDFPDGAA